MKFLLISVVLTFTVLAATFFMPGPEKSLAKNNPAPPAFQEQAQVLPTGQPEELGLVHWIRDLDAGRTTAQKSGKPMLILFQEVPGCSNCTRFGNTTLSHPLIVEAIETYFIPVCIYNNKGGKDAEALKTFGEPAWNNPVVRIVRADNQDIVLRMPEFNSAFQLVNGMRRALDLSGVAAPPYLELLEEELSARESGLQTATFSMYCFWTGEGIFGNLPGVVETESGYQDGKEVVKVQFDPVLTNRKQLEEQTQPKNVSACTKNEGFRADREPKYYLAQTDYRFIPMTTLQACRANSLVGKNQSPDDLLSPRQLALLKSIAQNPDKKYKNMIGRNDLSVAWAECN